MRAPPSCVTLEIFSDGKAPTGRYLVRHGNWNLVMSVLKLLVVLICLAAILQRLLPLAGINWL